MTPEEAYLFDLNGYLILRQVLPPEIVRDLNGEIDRLEALSDEEVASLGVPRGYYREDGDQLPVDYSCPLLKCGEAFEKLIDWAATVPYVEAMIREPHAWTRCISWCGNRDGPRSFTTGTQNCCSTANSPLPMGNSTA